MAWLYFVTKFTSRGKKLKKWNYFSSLTIFFQYYQILFYFPFWNILQNLGFNRQREQQESIHLFIQSVGSSIGWLVHSFTDLEFQSNLIWFWDSTQFLDDSREFPFVVYFYEKKFSARFLFSHCNWCSFY